VGRLILLILFYWILLFENGNLITGVLLDLGGGIEIRLSLLFKILFLVMNLVILVHFRNRHSIPLYLIVLSLFLSLSTFYVLAIDPAHFRNALAVNIHIQLMLNIILFIRYNAISIKEIRTFFSHLRFFAMLNAILVIVSYFLPHLIAGFEYVTSDNGVTRAFGIMGDEVSVFLSFFLYEALLNKRYHLMGLYLVAILLTSGLGAAFTLLVLLLFHLIFVMKKSRENLYGLAFLCLFLLIGGVFMTRYISDLGLVKRIEHIAEYREGESLGLRLLSFGVAMDMISKRPLLGYGYGNYKQSVINEYKPKFVDAQWENFFEGTAWVILSYTFNPFLQMTAESGFIGLLIFTWFLFMLYRSSFGVNEETSPVLGRVQKAAKIWIPVFFITTLSANWFLPSSFLLLLVVTLVGVSDKIKILKLGQYVEETS